MLDVNFDVNIDRNFDVMIVWKMQDLCSDWKMKNCFRSGKTVGSFERTNDKREKALKTQGFQGFSGSPCWTRTNDLRINSPSLYRLS